MQAAAPANPEEEVAATKTVEAKEAPSGSTTAEAEQEATAVKVEAGVAATLAEEAAAAAKAEEEATAAKAAELAAASQAEKEAAAAAAAAREAEQAAAVAAARAEEEATAAKAAEELAAASQAEKEAAAAREAEQALAAAKAEEEATAAKAAELAAAAQAEEEATAAKAAEELAAAAQAEQEAAAAREAEQALAAAKAAEEETAGKAAEESAAASEAEQEAATASEAEQAAAVAEAKAEEEEEATAAKAAEELAAASQAAKEAAAAARETEEAVAAAKAVEEATAGKAAEQFAAAGVPSIAAQSREAEKRLSARASVAASSDYILSSSPALQTMQMRSRELEGEGGVVTERAAESPPASANTALAFQQREQTTVREDDASIEQFMQGVLLKCGPILGYAFQKRWCVLTHTALMQYCNATSDTHMCFERLQTNSRAVRFTEHDAPGEAAKYQSEKPFGFVLDVNADAGKEHRLSYFDTKDEASLDLWLDKISQVVVKRNKAVTVHLYDVSTSYLPSAFPVGKNSSKIKAIGTGVFHVAVEVQGSEWSYGACRAEDGSGVFQCTNGPTKYNSHYREAVELGYTSMSEAEVSALMVQLQGEWLGKDYNQVTHNCCNFCEAVCHGLGVKQLPRWMAILAEVGTSMNNGDPSKTHGSNVLKQAKRRAEVECGERRL